jgi:hypothetical protein
MLNANIRSTTAELEPLLEEAEQLARISARRTVRPDAGTNARTPINDQMMIR